jgi:hypothetical protein
MLSNMSEMRPLMRSMYAAGVPLYGTCVMSVPVAALNISPARWFEVPGPPEPKSTLPGFAFRYATNSFTFFTGTEGFTASTRGVVATNVIGVKSLR